jgi:hypothetical protein
MTASCTVLAAMVAAVISASWSVQTAGLAEHGHGTRGPSSSKTAKALPRRVSHGGKDFNQI